MNNEFALERRKVGELNIPNGLVDITDPCYERSVWCRMNDVRVRPGKYDCFSFVGEIDDWGPRVWINQIVHQEVDEFDHFRMECIGSIGVDAGLAGFFAKDKNYSDKEWADFCSEINRQNKIFREPGDTLYRSYFKIDEDGKSPVGFFTQSGCGDGGYDVYAAKVGDEIVALEIRFISEEEFEEVFEEDD